MEQRSIQVGFLHDSVLESAAYQLIGQYQSRYNLGENDPIPVDSILESYLGLTFEIEDLKTRLDMQDVLGATWIDEETVRIDESLDPTVSPIQEGRYNFTVAHEIGHWVLHRPLFQMEEAQESLFENSNAPTIVCRSSKKKEPMEIQADIFASCLLMPRDRVIAAWHDLYGNYQPTVIYAEPRGFKSLASIFHPVSEVAKTMARRFRVSGQAMQYRLEKLQLIRPNGPIANQFI